ncbi:MAG: corrinoid protein [Finegoldia sp.]|nr:corrinoid protein [Finegoldia sp.]
MARAKEEIIANLKQLVVDMEDDETAKVAQEYVDAGYEPYDAIMDGLVAGMNVVSDYYDQGEYFITDVLIASDAMYNGLDVLKPHLKQDEGMESQKTVVIGVVEGDTHDIGKNLVTIMLDVSGFKVIDLGKDVPLQKFVDTAVEENADIVCMSTLMTTTMPGMKTVIDGLEEAGVRDKVKVMIGGGPVSDKFAEKIGADCYTETAVDAAKAAKKLCGLD